MLVCIAMLNGCALLELEDATYETVQASPHRDTEKARKLNGEATDLIAGGKLERAEQVLQKALVADVTYGPAHNNLGRIYYEQRQLYLAAWEFEYASQLMPQRAEPLNNLGLVYEAIRRFPEAVGYYEDAYARDPRHPELLTNLARARLRTGEESPETERLLTEVALRNDRPEARDWAVEQLQTSHLALAGVGHALFDFGAPVVLHDMPPVDDTDAGLGPMLPILSPADATPTPVDQPPEFPRLEDQSQ